MENCFAVECNSPLYAKITLMGTKIIALSLRVPDPYKMKATWLINELSDVNISEIEIVLISDPRSLYVADLLLTFPDFNGIILCTEAVYRIGRALSIW